MSAKKPKFIKPPNKIKMKVGHGGIDERLINRGQTFIEKNDVAFEPFANDHLKKIKKLISTLQKEKTKEKEEELVSVIMQLKANGGMFKYQLISDVANVALYFLETIDELNNDALNVIDVHYKTMHVIISNQLKGDGGKEGYSLAKELERACNRYFKKYPTK